jgi:hypothetical protein
MRISFALGVSECSASHDASAVAETLLINEQWPEVWKLVADS